MERLIAERNYRNTSDRLINFSLGGDWLSDKSKQQINDLATQLSIDNAMVINGKLDEILKGDKISFLESREKARQDDLQGFYYGPFCLLLALVTYIFSVDFPRSNEYFLLVAMLPFAFGGLGVIFFWYALVAWLNPPK